MSEIEVHHVDHTDTLGRRVGVMVGLLGILLAVVTISSHRAHTAAVVHRTEANDDWAYYQAKKIRQHTAEVAKTLTQALGTDPAKVSAAVDSFNAMSGKYTKDAEEIKKQADDKIHRTEEAEHKALAFDLGEGFLELGLVLSSLYFMGRQRLFPIAGLVAALAGLSLGVLGFLGGEWTAGLARLFVD